MAIAFDATTGNHANRVTTSTLTVSHTCTGSNLILWVVVNVDQSANTEQCTGVTYNNVAMTKVADVAVLTGGCGNVSLWYLVGPATGANNIVATKNGTTKGMNLASASYTGVQQTGQPDATQTTTVTGSQTNLTQTVVSVADNSWMVVCSTNSLGAVTAGTNETLRYADSFGFCLGDSNAAITPAGSHALTTNGASAVWGGVAATFSPATGGGATVLPYRALMGVGI